MIEIPVEVNGSTVTLKFRPMKTEEAAEWGSKIQSRIAFKEALEKSLAVQEETPADERDFDKYMGTIDKITRLTREIVEASASVKRFIVEPAPKEVESLLEREPVKITQAFGLFFEKSFPEEEEQKKS